MNFKLKTPNSKTSSLILFYAHLADGKRFVYSTGQNYLFDLINLPPEKKKHYVYDSGHFVPRQEQIQFHLDWLNKFLTND